jgi:hypothetical protein
MNFCKKALENEVKSVAKLSNNIHILKPVLSCPEAEKYLCVWCLSVFFNGDIYSIQNRHPNFSSKTQQQQLYIE